MLASSHSILGGVMKTLTLTDMGVLEAGYVKGYVCGFMVGSMMGAAFLWGPLSASLIFMFTPLTCVLEYGFQR
jgi:hypothetical protein